MSILDDAIREHLELKRQHGAAPEELKRLEDEAFGPALRPDEEADPFAEAPTEFLQAPESGEAQPEVEPGPGGRPANVADLQEAPPRPSPPDETGEPEAGAESTAEEPAAAESAEHPAAETPAVEEHPAMEHDVVPEPEASTEPAPDAISEPESAPADATEQPGQTTEERHAIAEQPTQMFDVESEMRRQAGEPDASSGEADEPPAAEAGELAPPDETDEPPAAEVDAPPNPEPAAEPEPNSSSGAPAFDEEDDFFDEQRLSDELDQALGGPPAAATSPPTEEAPLPAPEQLDEEPERDDDEQPYTDEHERLDAHEDDDADGNGDDEPLAAEAAPPQPATEQQRPEHVDALEDTPDFLEESPEDDQLWFEQKPPKDFDFDD